MCPEVIIPTDTLDSTFIKLPSEYSTHTAILRRAFFNVEATCPGFSDHFISRLLDHLGFAEDVSSAEFALRLSVLEEPTIFHHTHPSKKIVPFIHDALSLRSALVRIPDTIKKDECFTGMIRDIAIALKKFLDSSSIIFSLVQDPQRRTLKEHFQKFMILCRSFSYQLKIYFTTADKDLVFESATALVQHIDLIVQTID